MPLLLTSRVLRKAFQLFLVFTAVFILLYLRRPTTLTRPQFWAEDGAIFFREQLIYGGHAVLHTYAGYLLLIPRSIAFCADKFDPAAGPLLYGLSALMVAALCCTTMAFDCFHPMLPSQPMRIALSLLAATIAQCDESIGNIANLQWWLLIPALLFTFLPAQKAEWRGKMGFGLLGLLLALTAPGCIIAVPFVLILLVRRRAISTYQIGLLLGLAIQVGVTLAHPVADLKTPLLLRVDQTTTATFHALGNQVVLSAFVGHKLANQMISQGYLGVGFFCLIGLFVAVMAGYFRGKSNARLTLVTAFLLLLSSLALSMFFRANLRDIFQAANHYLDLMADRYFLFPSCLLAFVVAILIHGAARRFPAVQVPALVLVFSVGLIYNFHVRQAQDMHWAQYAPALRQWKTDHASRQAGPALAVPITPLGFHVELPPPEQVFE